MKPQELFDIIQRLPLGTHDKGRLYNHFIGIKQNIGELSSLHTTNKSSLVDAINEVSEVNKNYIEITYAELKTLKNNNNLAAGRLYRITDYVTTTTQEFTTSAGHPFDIIVLATSNSTFDEHANAIQHEGDTYFANNKLSAWKLWYSFDNDINKFVWADDTNGKGVIYRMIDEFNNDCPYDFKNIQFYRKWDNNKSLWSTILLSSSPDAKPCYTFSQRGVSTTESFEDKSLNIGTTVFCHNNVIYFYYENGKQKLNNICLFSNRNNYNNTFNKGCYNITLGENCYKNNFYSSSLIVLGNYCYYNIFYSSYNITLDNSSSYNIFNESCSHITLNGACIGNTFGQDCEHIAFNNYCNYNTIGVNSNRIEFDNHCSYNIVDNANTDFNEPSIELPKWCSYNKFDAGLKRVVVLEEHTNNLHVLSSASDMGVDVEIWIDSFEYTDFHINSIDAQHIVVDFIKYDWESEEYTPYNNIQFDFVQVDMYGIYSWKNNDFNTIYTDSNSSTNCQIGDMYMPSERGYFPVDIYGCANRNYVTTVAKKSNGKLVKYCEADLIADQY